MKSTAPAPASSAPSHAMPRASRPRDAPSAMHIANSSARASVRINRSMPTVVQAITHVIPARYFLVALRAIVLKGAALGTTDTLDERTKRDVLNHPTRPFHVLYSPSPTPSRKLTLHVFGRPLSTQ